MPTRQPGHRLTITLPERDLEFRLERLKRLGNLRLDYLKRFYERESIAEGYAQNRLEAHLHGTLDGLSLCMRYRHLGADAVVMDDGKEFIVFVEVAHPSKRYRPFSSLVRLQLLDCCDMFVREATEVVLSPTREALWRVFDRKLCASLFASAIAPSKLTDQVVEGTPKSVGEFSDQHLAFIGDRRVRACDFHGGENYFSCREVCSGCVLRLDDCSLGLLTTNLTAQRFQPLQVFTCPIYQDVGITQGGGHELDSTTDSVHVDLVAGGFKLLG